MSVVLVPLWQGQRPNGLMGIARDISERARQEATRLEDAKKAARAEAQRRLADELEGAARARSRAPRASSSAAPASRTSPTA